MYNLKYTLNLYFFLVSSYNKDRKKQEGTCLPAVAATFCDGTPTIATWTGHGFLGNYHASDVIRVVRGQSVAWQHKCC